jgi:hypothetical protein
MNSTEHYNNMSNSQIQGSTVNVQGNSRNMRHYEMRGNGNRDSVIENRGEERGSFSMMMHENESLVKENMNLKEETVYLGNEIDRINN